MPPQSVSGPPTPYEDPVTDGADSVVEELEKSINVEKLVGNIDTTFFHLHFNVCSYTGQVHKVVSHHQGHIPLLHPDQRRNKKLK